MRERVPIARTAFGGGVGAILSEKAHNCLVVAEQRSRIDITACDFGMRGKNFQRAIKRAMPYRHVDEFVSGVFVSGLGFRHVSLIMHLPALLL